MSEEKYNDGTITWTGKRYVARDGDGRFLATCRTKDGAKRCIDEREGREEYTCVQCGTPCVRRHRSGNMPKYCGTKCANLRWVELNAERRIEINDKARVARYGLTIHEWQNMLDEHNHKCAICSSKASGGNTSSSKLHIDHCHATGKVRGLLCSKCNTALGSFKDDVGLLRRAAEYLELYQ